MPMKILRKSKQKTFIFSASWLLMSFCYTCWAECLFCNYGDFRTECCDKTHAEECFLDTTSLSQACQCQCISFGNFSRNELLRRRECINSFRTDQQFVLKQVPFDCHFFIIEQNIVCYQNNTPLLRYPSLFLINSSFLL